MFFEIILVLLSVVVLGALLVSAGYAAIEAVTRAGRAGAVGQTSAEVIECAPTPPDVALDAPYRARIRFQTVHGAEVETVAGQEAPVAPATSVLVRYRRADPREIVPDHAFTGARSYAWTALFLLVLALLGFQQLHVEVLETVTGWFGTTPPDWRWLNWLDFAWLGGEH